MAGRQKEPPRHPPAPPLPIAGLWGFCPPRLRLCSDLGSSILHEKPPAPSAVWGAGIYSVWTERKGWGLVEPPWPTSGLQPGSCLAWAGLWPLGSWRSNRGPSPSQSQCFSPGPPAPPTPGFTFLVDQKILSQAKPQEQRPPVALRNKAPPGRGFYFPVPELSPEVASLPGQRWSASVRGTQTWAVRGLALGSLWPRPGRRAVRRSHPHLSRVVPGRPALLWSWGDLRLGTHPWLASLCWENRRLTQPRVRHAALPRREQVAQHPGVAFRLCPLHRQVPHRGSSGWGGRGSF